MAVVRRACSAGSCRFGLFSASLPLYTPRYNTNTFIHSVHSRQRAFTHFISPAYPGHDCSRASQMETKAPQRVPEANAAGLVVGYSTASSNEEARAIAQHLVTERLAACVQIVPAIESVYEWKGTLEKSSEVLLIIKTQRTYTQAVVQAIKDKHSYEIPEVVFTDVVDGNPDYLEWVRAVTRSKGT